MYILCRVYTIYIVYEEYIQYVQLPRATEQLYRFPLTEKSVASMLPALPVQSNASIEMANWGPGAQMVVLIGLQCDPSSRATERQQAMPRFNYNRVD